MFTIDKHTDQLIKTVETKVIVDLVKISPKDDLSKFCIMPRKFVNQDLERIKNMEIFEDDIWVITFPKCGTTWTQEIVWLLNNNLDYEAARNTFIDVRFPFIE